MKNSFILGIIMLIVSILDLGAMQMNENLTQREKFIVKISSLTSDNQIKELKIILDEALNNGLTINEIKEVLIQVYAYAGFPRSLNGISAFKEVLESREKKGIIDKVGEIPKELSKNEDKWKYGNDIQIKLVGQEVKGGIMDFLPAIDTFLKEHLFADIFLRGVLSFQDREIVTIAILNTLEGVDSQLNSHINMGKNIGLTDNQILEISQIVKNTIKIKQPFDIGIKNPYEKYFTGQTYLNMLNAKDDIFNAPLGNVTFEPKARTFWHKHSGGQILLVTSGEGRYQEKGKEIQILNKGDIVKIAPNVEHWHGASPNNWFSHISLETNVPNNKVTWLNPVKDEEYK